jgi:hypothetical protein
VKSEKREKREHSNTKILKEKLYLKEKKIWVKKSC